VREALTKKLARRAEPGPFGNAPAIQHRHLEHQAVTLRGELPVAELDVDGMTN